MVTETERQFYLAAAGIRLWYARDPLPGAAPSPAFEFLPESSPQPLPAVATVTAPLAPEPGASAQVPASGPPVDLRALIAGADKKSGSARASFAKEASQEQAPAAGAVISRNETSADAEAGTAVAVRPLTLQVWAGRRFALVADVSADTSLKLQQNLARNILLSIGESEPECYGPAQWPVFNNRAVTGSRPEDLLAIVRDLLEPVAGHSLLLMGLSDMDGAGDSGGWLCRAGDYKAALEFPHSLAELAGQPGLKRSLWQQLKTRVIG